MSTNPNTVKSQDDTTEDELGRTMTLLRAIEQLEKTECELEKVEKQLDIAIWALNSIKHGERTIKDDKGNLQYIESYALEKIGGVKQMRWEYCEQYYIDGHCENQDRGHECENYGKRMKDRCERLQKQLEIAEMALKEIEKSGTNPVIKTITTLCVNNFLLAHKALKEIEELNK